jgi:hypothetical protein
MICKESPPNQKKCPGSQCHATDLAEQGWGLGYPSVCKIATKLSLCCRSEAGGAENVCDGAR